MKNVVNLVAAQLLMLVGVYFIFVSRSKQASIIRFIYYKTSKGKVDKEDEFKNKSPFSFFPKSKTLCLLWLSNGKKVDLTPKMLQRCFLTLRISWPKIQ